MAYDKGLAQILRNDLAGDAGISEKHMFGGISFLLNGNMLCGVHSGGAMFRVGQVLEVEALSLPGVREMAFTGRKMGGFVEVDDEFLADETRRECLLDMAREYVGLLPPK